MKPKKRIISGGISCSWIEVVVVAVMLLLGKKYLLTIDTHVANQWQINYGHRMRQFNGDDYVTQFTWSNDISSYFCRDI